MGQIWARVRDLLLGHAEMRLLMLGLDAAGKTSIVYRMQLGEPVHTIPTIGFNVETIHYKSNSITIFDVGGQSKLRPLWRHYFNGADALIFVVDSADSARLEDAQQELHRILAAEELRRVPVLILANKQDLPDAITGAQMSERMRMGALREQPWYVQARA
jgi:ADP-ribosylation factor protein 1